MTGITRITGYLQVTNPATPDLLNGGQELHQFGDSAVLAEGTSAHVACKLFSHVLPAGGTGSDLVSSRQASVQHTLAAQKAQQQPGPGVNIKQRS